ncbi:hypothetical protein ISS07_01170 [Candidatus Woesearchaeota archaeon]|nr:hypothetical protein [Candidatus Woesearchaeota archaeon]
MDAYSEMGGGALYLQYKGVWDMQDLYEFIASFFSGKKFKFYEKKYITKHPSPFGPETYYIWEAKRDVEEYYRYMCTIFLHTYDTQDVEVVGKDGSKKMFTKGRLWIQIQTKVVLDYDKRWDETAFYKSLKNFYTKYVMKKKIEGLYWDNMYYNVHLKLHSLIKERLKLESEGFEHRYFNKMR